jgi:hypothetical protein
MRSAKSLLALVVILGGLVAYLYFVDANRPVTPEGTEARDKVFTVDAGKIEEVTIKASSGDTTSVKRAKDGWQVTAPVATKADESEVSNITSSLAPAEVTSVVDEQPKSVDQYGLKDPQVVVAFKTDDHKEHHLRIGSKTPTGGDVYAQSGDQKRVFLIPAYVETSFDKKPFDLREKIALKFERDKADRLDITHGDVHMEFVKNGMDWRMTAPIDARGDFSAVEGLITRLQSAQMSSLVSADASDLVKFGLEKPAAVATVGAGSSRATLLIGKPESGENATGVYAKDASRPMVFTLPKDLSDDIQKGVTDFRRKDVFEFRSFNAKKIEITRGAETLVFEKAKGTGKDATESWRRVKPTAGTVDGGKMDAALGKLSSLRAEAFADPKTPTGLDSPAAIVRATFDEKNRTEEVKFGKTGSDVYASRADEPGAMRVPASDFDDAMKQLDALK